MITYFAYGSNMNPERIGERIGRVPIGRSASLRDYVLRFSARSKDDLRTGYGNIEPQAGSIVHGVAYDLTEEELGKIDVYEGVAWGHYYRETVELATEQEGRISAIAYVTCAEWVSEGLKPPRWYLDHLLAGRDLLPQEYAQWLAEHRVLENQDER